ncbi:MAG TPA: hypothetical protein VFB32_01065 [Rudaea sp.]|nr:hypothetical protein [Rudaea sp.]
MSSRWALAGAMLALSSIAAEAATITIQIDPSEPAGTGFTDPTPVAPVGSNPGTTRGAQRLFVFQTAATQWGQLLNSNVSIVVMAKMTSIAGGCNGTSAILGQAGPDNAFENFANAPKANTFYAVALADSLSGTSNDPGNPQIDATFNVDIDTGTCLTGVTWWYDTNPADAIPSGRVALMPVVFHELGHGLGFITFTNLSNGSFVFDGTAFRPDVWDDYLFDQVQNKTWTQINPTGGNNSTIVNSSIDDPNLVWAGSRVNKQAKDFLGAALVGTHSGCMRLHAPNPQQPGSSVSHWTSAANPHLLMQPVLNQTLFNKVDLTLPLFADIGWSVNPQEVLFTDGFDPNPCPSVQP